MRETSLTNEHNFSPNWLTRRKTRSYLLSGLLFCIGEPPKRKFRKLQHRKGGCRWVGAQGGRGVGVGGSAGEEKSVGSKQEVL